MMPSMIASNEIIKKAIEFIKEKIAPEKIYLFGSYAQGNPTENSDLDFLIVKQTNLPKPKRSATLYSLDKTKRIGVPIGIDFIIYTPEEFEKSKIERNSLAGEVTRTGKLVYGK
jgi:predicted nucleotidyltransferase